MPDFGTPCHNAELSHHVVACGIDRWLGGVHLQSGGTLWRWDNTRKRVVPGPAPEADIS